MAEWSIALPWKGSNWVTGSGVRIPVSPPFLLYLLKNSNVTKTYRYYKVNKRVLYHNIYE